MRIWDSSALVPLCVAQPSTAHARALLRKYPAVVWWGSIVERSPAISQVERAGGLSEADAGLARGSLAQLRITWFEVQPGDVLRAQAIRLLRLHPLRPAHALQLASAFEWAGSPPLGAFVTIDERLRSATLREGLSVPSKAHDP